MAIIFALLCALAYGSSDFIAGLASRHGNTGVVVMIVQPFGLVAALLALAWFGGGAPTASILAWGAVSGVGGGVGAAVFYRGLAVGRMSVVAALSAVISAVLPAIVGTILGQPLSMLTLAGILVAIPAIIMVSWQGGEAGKNETGKNETGKGETGKGSRGVAHGIVAGAGFALLFIALDRAGTAAGAWPLVPGQIMAILIIIPFAWHSIRGQPLWRSSIRASLWPSVAAGMLGGAANLLFLAATGRGQLAIVAVISSLYSAVTILLARVIIKERWNRLQAAGLFATAAAIILVSAG